jgi:hypothetical protein
MSIPEEIAEEKRTIAFLQRKIAISVTIMLGAGVFFLGGMVNQWFFVLSSICAFIHLATARHWSESAESIKHARGRLAVLEYEQSMPEEVRQPLASIDKFYDSRNRTPGS